MVNFGINDNNISIKFLNGESYCLGLASIYIAQDTTVFNDGMTFVTIWLYFYWAHSF